MGRSANLRNAKALGAFAENWLKEHNSIRPSGLIQIEEKVVRENRPMTPDEKKLDKLEHEVARLKGRLDSARRRENIAKLQLENARTQIAKTKADTALTIAEREVRAIDSEVRNAQNAVWDFKYGLEEKRRNEIEETKKKLAAETTKAPTVKTAKVK